MFIRRTLNRRTAGGQAYYTHRLVCSERLGKSVRQRTLLSLGRHFAVPKEEWSLLCSRISEVLNGQDNLLERCSSDLEEEAQRIAARLLVGGSRVEGVVPEGRDIQAVDVNSMELVRPRSVGVEQVGLWALGQVGLAELLTGLGVTGKMRKAALALIVGRMAYPASERATYHWLKERSGFGELIGLDFGSVSAMLLYRASDVLIRHRAAIEAHVFSEAMSLFELEATITLYDLTNTFYEGGAAQQPLARRGHSKDRRRDAPLLTLGLVLDASGFVRRSEVFAGNVREQKTLAEMLEALEAPAGTLVVMDRGVATAGAIGWLRDNGYRYLVVSRERHRRFDPDTAVQIQTRSEKTLRLYKEVNSEGDEVRLHCFSEQRAAKERAIVERISSRFEAALTGVHEGLARPRTRKKIDFIWERIGRIKKNHSRVSAHYDIEVTASEDGQKAVAISWTRRPIDGSILTHPGVYCLRSSETEWDEQTLWRTYSTLTDVEAVFRSLKSELGLRPIYHQKPVRAEGHLFITVVAYQLVQLIRARLRARGHHSSWTTLRRILEGQHRVTATFARPDGRTLHLRQATQPEAKQQAIYEVLGVDPKPGGVMKTIV